MLKLKLMLTQPPTELELELGLSLAIIAVSGPPLGSHCEEHLSEDAHYTVVVFEQP